MSRMHASRMALFVATLLSCLAGCARAGSSPASVPIAADSPHYDVNAKIEWHAFEKGAFERARRENKLVLVDVGIEGCTACRWMYEETYRNPAVVARVRESFVAVAVDADIQPDLGARFEEWGWPATIAFTPDGEQVLALRGSRTPAKFIPILEELIEKKKKGELHAARESTPASTKRDERSGALRDACVRISGAFDRDMNREHGGWSDNGQYIQGFAIEAAFLRAQVEKRPELRAHALKTLDGYAKMMDAEWGGIFVAAHSQDFTSVIPEKRLVQEAEAMRGFAMAYAATGDEKWRTRAKEIDRYVEGFLLAPDGTFYSTQQDEAPGWPADMTSDEYFKLPDAQRRKLGIPPVDHAVYTDQNGQQIEAYARLYEATGDAHMLARATRAANALLATRLQPAGFIAQVAASKDLRADARKRAFRPVLAPYLTAQAHFANALVALHRVTGEARWLEAARGIMKSARATLEDRSANGGGGFFASPNDASVPGAAEKPVYENIVAARALHSLAVYGHDDSLDAVAERTLRAIPSGGGAIFALAVQDLALGPVELSISGPPGDPRAIALYEAALKVDEPRKAVHFDTAKRYPDRGKPALYVCTKNSCSSAVYDPAAVAAAVIRAGEVHPTACE